MIKKIDERIPQNSGDGANFKKYNAIQSPWNKLYSYQEALHYASRFEAVLSAATMQALRIIIPDYVERTQLMCEEAYERIILQVNTMEMMKALVSILLCAGSL